MLKDKLKEYRELCDFSQQQVADCLNIHRSTYSYYELGKTEPSLDNILTISRLFGVSLNDLLEVPTAPHKAMRDAGGYGAGGRLDETVGTKVGDLSKDEQVLVMRFRLLTEKQRKDLLIAMGDSRDGDEK